jgi:hypothetical protein
MAFAETSNVKGITPGSFFDSVLAFAAGATWKHHERNAMGAPGKRPGDLP